MTNVRDALNALGITGWALNGKPKTEAEFLTMFQKVIAADSNNKAIYTSDASEFGVTWQEITDKISALDAAAPMQQLRLERNEKLAETDYLALSDVTMSDEMQTYRQALRDLPPNTSDPANPVWPTKPGG